MIYLFINAAKIINLFQSDGKNFDKLFQSDGKNLDKLFQSDGKNPYNLFQSDGRLFFLPQNQLFAIFVPQEEQKSRWAKFFVPQLLHFLKSSSPQCLQNVVTNMDVSIPGLMPDGSSHLRKRKSFPQEGQK